MLTDLFVILLEDFFIIICVFVCVYVISIKKITTCHSSGYV